VSDTASRNDAGLRPAGVRHRGSTSLARAGRYGRAAARWARLLLSRGSQHRVPGVRVFYGHDRVPEPGDAVAGGSAKIQRLAARFPNHPDDFSIAYLGSNWVPRDLGPLLRYLRRRHVPLVVNQNGVGYPGWAGSDTDAVNRPLRALLAAADHVLYQSEFCKRAADEWVGPCAGSWEVLYNAVDVSRFMPAERPPEDGPVLLLGGDQTQAYRLELALETLAALVPSQTGARLLVTGRVLPPLEPAVARLGLEGRVHALGRYSQADAPELFRRAHVLLHTKVNDPCPSVVIEAMATGIPVVYARSGGVPELVGDDAGVGVPHPDGFERDEPPSADALADAVARVLGSLRDYGAAARARAVERFSLEPWLDRHAELFELLAPR
jgi:glycosyltransferase involved in cell wall biosynthesis